MGRMNDLSIKLDQDAQKMAATWYEIAGHCGKIAHLFNRMAEMIDKDAELTTDNQTTDEGQEPNSYTT